MNTHADDYLAGGRGRPPSPDKSAMRASLDALFDLDEVIELRAIHKGRKRIDAGYFDAEHREGLVNEAARLNGAGAAIYVNLNLIDPQLLGRYSNRIQDYAKETVTDKDVIRRRGLLIDFDAVRPANTSATDAQVAAAKECAAACRQALEAEGWPQPLVGVSGNGMHLVYPLDLPNDAESAALVKGALAGLAGRFDTDTIKIDQSCSNAGRVIKLYGSLALKGDHTPTSPWRLACLVSGSCRNGTIVTADQLRALHPKGNGADPKAGSAWGREEFDLPAFLSRLGISYDQDMHEGAERYKLEHCPFNSAHGWGDAAILRQPDGRLGFRCQHDSCRNKHWQDVRELVDGPKEGRASWREQGREAPPLAVYEADARRHADGEEGKGNGDDAETSAAQNPLPPLAAQQRALADLASLALHPRCVVQDYLYDDAGELIAPGGTGKTTLLLYEAIHIVLGMLLYGLKVVSPGPVVLLTAEDGADVLYARLREIMSGLGLSDEQKIKVLASVYIADLCGMDLRLACRKDGTIKPTALADHIIERYGPINPAVITIDPRVSFGVGEQQYSNDDAQALLTAARRIVRALQCCVRYIHHTGIQNAREWRLDQYSGRGASAMPDGCRMVAVMQPWFPETEVPLPPGVTHGPGESVMVLARAKGSYHEPWQPHIWITRRKWSFSHTIAGPTDKEAEAKACTDQIERYLIEKLKAGYRFTQNVLQDMGDVNMPRKALRDAVATLRATGRVVLAPLPESERQGGKQTYLHPIKAGPPSTAPATAPATAPETASAQLGKAPPSQASAVHPTTAPEPHPPTGGGGTGGAVPPVPTPLPPEQLRRRSAAQCGAVGAVGGNDSAEDGASPHADNTDSDVEAPTHTTAT